MIFKIRCLRKIISCKRISYSIRVVSSDPETTDEELSVSKSEKEDRFNNLFSQDRWILLKIIDIFTPEML